MEYATLIVLLALLQYVWFTARVGLKRGKYHVNAPACEGDENWERLFRVQQNTPGTTDCVDSGKLCIRVLFKSGLGAVAGRAFHHWPFCVFSGVCQRPQDTCPRHDDDHAGQCNIGLGCAIRPG